MSHSFQGLEFEIDMASLFELEILSIILFIFELMNENGDFFLVLQSLKSKKI